jgi:transcriptional regulator with XRE-family HTH domain
VSTSRDLPRDVGSFIRDLRQNAKISLRQLAEQAGVSNPYLSQIENGLRKPSAEVLAQLASALRVSTPVMYLRAGLLELADGHGSVVDAIAGDPDLTESQKQTLTQIYETFRRENAREADRSSSTGGSVPASRGGDAVSIGDGEAVVSASDVATAAPPKKATRAAKGPAVKEQ